MGTIKKGILGGFSGKVGTVVGGSWNSISYMRSLADSYSDAKTERQVCQRGRFSAAVTFMKNIAPYVRIGFRNCEAGQSPYSAAMSFVLKNAVVGCGEEAVVNFSKVLVSQGGLTGVADAAVEVAGGKASFTWTDNGGIGNAKSEDVAMVLAYNKDRQEAVYDLQAAARADGAAELTLPAAWEDEALAVYLSFRSVEGRTVTKSVCLLDDEAVQEPDEEPGGGGTDGGTSGGSGTGGEGNEGSFG